MRDVPQQAVDLIKTFEGFSPKAYFCPAEVLSIGYGRTKDVKIGDICTEQQAEDWLKEECRSLQEFILKNVRVGLNDNQLSALISLVYNIGRGNFLKSTLLHFLNKGWYDQVPQQIMRWNKSKGEVMGGLTRRRVAESGLFRS